MRATDARGECALNVRGSLDFIPVSVEKAGYFPVQRSADPRQVVEIRLHRTATLVGRLLAADTGELVPGARIRIEHPGCTGCERDTARADPDGRYELAGVPLRLAGTRIHLVAEGFAAETRRLEIRSDEERIDQDFQLERGVVLEGRVIDFVTGGAVPGASVSEQPTDELGRFRLRVLPRGIEQWVGLRVRAPGYCELQGGCTPDTCLSGELLELRLPRSATVEGCVSDPSGAPVAGAEVWLVGDRRRRAAESNSGNATPLDELPADWNLSSEGERARASTDAGGCFEITNAVPWTSGWLVEARCEGFEPVRVELERTPGPTERVRLDLVLVPRVDSPDGTVEGLVTLNGAFRYELSGEVRWKGPTRSGSDTFHNGAYHQDVEPGKVELSIEVDSLSGLLRGDTLVVDVAQGEELRRDVDVRVPAAAIRGRVTHPDGQPVGDVEVSACSEVRAWKQLFSARTDRQGAYSIEVPDWVPSYRVTVALAGLELEARAVRAGSRGIDFTLPKAGKVHLRARTTDTGRLVDGWVFDVLARSGEERSFQPWNWAWKTRTAGSS